MYKQSYIKGFCPQCGFRRLVKLGKHSEHPFLCTRCHKFSDSFLTAKGKMTIKTIKKTVLVLPDRIAIKAVLK